MAALLIVGPAAAHDCKCRYAGQSYKQGQIVCILGKLARCGMFLNNSSWNFVAETCPQARSAVQRVAAMPMEGTGAHSEAAQAR